MESGLVSYMSCVKCPFGVYIFREIYIPWMKYMNISEVVPIVMKSLLPIALSGIC